MKTASSPPGSRATPESKASSQKSSAPSAVSQKTRNRLVRNRKFRNKHDKATSVTHLSANWDQTPRKVTIAAAAVDTPSNSTLASSVSALSPPTPSQQLQQDASLKVWNEEVGSPDVASLPSSSSTQELSPPTPQVNEQRAVSCTSPPSSCAMTQQSTNVIVPASSDVASSVPAPAPAVPAKAAPMAARPPLPQPKRSAADKGTNTANRHKRVRIPTSTSHGRLRKKPAIATSSKAGSHAMSTTTTTDARTTIVRYQVDPYAMQQAGHAARLEAEVARLCEQSNVTALPELAELLSQRHRRHDILERPDALSHILGVLCRLKERQPIDLSRHAATLVVQYVSLACTPQAKSPETARHVRRHILKHHGAIQGIFQLACNQHGMVNRLLCKPSFPEAPASPVKSTTTIASTQESPASVASTASSMGSRSSTGSRDRAKVGRLKRLQKRPALSRDCRQRQRATEMIDHLFDKLENDEMKAEVVHECGTTRPDRARLPLLALQRILTGRLDDHGPSCLDDDHEHNNGNLDDGNHLALTNQWLRDGGVLPTMAMGFAETLAAATRCRCVGCAVDLSQRILVLSSMMENACLMDAENTKALVLEGFTEAASGYLVFGALDFLKHTMEESNILTTAGVWDDAFLSVLRTLTSLTHECMDAAKEIFHYTLSSDRDEVFGRSGLHLLARIFVEATLSSSIETEKLRYDARILVLNVLANMLDSGSSRTMFLKLHAGSTNKSFLAFLVQFLVEQTRSFEDAVLSAFGGSTDSGCEQRELDEQESERLVLAGNGFIMISYLLVDSVSSSDETSFQLRKIVLDAVPGASRPESITFVKNVLRAFCNHYRSRVGDLYLVLKGPIDALLRGLDAIDYTTGPDEAEASQGVEAF